MATQYTSILKLALPVTGELSGTWGDVVNNNITSMVEQAIAGLSTINTWTANAHTLTVADGTTSESRCAMLVADTGAGGTALTAAGEIICPAASKLYVLKNGAAYAVTLKTAAGTGVAVPAGDTAFLFCDGTNVNACVTTIVNGHISGNLTVDGNTTLGDANTDTVTVTAQFASDLLPSTDNARDLGSTAKSWRTLYCDTSVLTPLVTATNLQVTNIKANDGTAAMSIADSTGAITVSTLLNVDNLRLDGNTLSSTDSNGNVVLAPNGTGDVQLDADTVRIGDSNANATITTNGTGDLILNTNSGTNSGSITIEDGVNGNIIIAPNGTGQVQITNAALDLTTIEVSNINAKDGTAAITIADSTGAVGISTAVTMSATTQNIALGTSQTSGTFTVGGTAQTGTQTFDQSTKTHTLNVGSGATESGLTKTVNIGTGGVATSTTAINIGSTNGTTITLNGTVNATTVNVTTLDLTNLEVTNIKAKDGTAAMSIADSTGAVTVSSAFAANGGVTIGDASGDAFTINSSAVSTPNGLNFDSDTFVIDATNNRVGIGTNAPVAQLQVNRVGDGTYASTLAESRSKAGLILNPESTGSSVALNISKAVGGNAIIYQPTNSAATTAYDNIFNPFGGNVGIGTTSPDYKLQVSGTTGQTFSIERVASAIGSSTSLGTIVGTGEIPTLTADGASIQFLGAGTWSATSAPGRIVFNTTPVSATTPVERFQLTTGEAVVNDPGEDYDFRVESDTNTHAFFVQGSDGFVGIGTSSPTNLLSVAGNANITGNVTLGDASTDTVTVNGYMGVGGAGTSNAAVYLTSTALTGTSQYGFYSTPRASSSATSQAAGFTALVRTENATFTLTNAYGVSVENVSKGASSTITNQHGLYVADQTQGTNNFGITSVVSSGTNKWNIYASGTAANYFAGNVQFAAGAAATPSLTRFGDDNTGFWFPAADTIAASTNGVERLRLSTTEAVFNDPGNDYDFRVESDNNTHMLFVDAGNSRVGFGTASPNTDVEISTTVDPILRLNNSTNTVTNGADIGEIQFYTNDASTSGTGVKAFVKTVAQAFGANQGGADLVFGTAAYAVGDASEKMRIDKDGNLIQTVNTTAATLTTNQTLTFSIVDNSTLRISVRGSDGTTRTATIALT